jgi:GAF domain-containing protein
LSAASIFRLVLFVISRSVSCNGTAPNPISQPVPNSGATSIVIDDIMADEGFSPCRQVVSHAGVRAVQSTPILSSSGALLGIISTHFAAPHRPTKIELRELQHAAHLAADALIRVKASRYSLDEQIGRSLKLVEQSREEMARADGLLPREHVRRRPVA